MAKVGKRVATLRQRRMLTVRELAARSGIAHSTISLIERDKDRLLNGNKYLYTLISVIEMAKILSLFMLFLVNFSIGQELDSLNVTKDSTYNSSNVTSVLDPELDLIVAPTDFDVSPYFHGYVNLRKRSAIVMREVENFGAEEVMMAADNENFYTKEGLTLLAKKEFVSQHGTKGAYLLLSFLDKKGVKFTRYMVYAGNNENTLVLDIVHPVEFELEADVLKCLNSINYSR